VASLNDGSTTSSLTRTTFDELSRVVATIQNYQNGTFDASHTDEDVTTRTTYDALGRAVSTVDPTGATTTYGFNGLGQTVVVTDNVGRVSRMGYDGSGAQRWTITPDGRFTVVQRDGLGHVTTTIQNYEDGLVAADEPTDRDLHATTVYDTAGRRVQTIDAAGRVTAFGYDLQDRLVWVQENQQTGTCTHAPCNVLTHYQYDRVGNRTAIVDANGHIRRFSYDAADQQVTATDVLGNVTSWEYDRGGRRTRHHSPRGSTWRRSYSYDDLDRLTQVVPGGQAPELRYYDALGRQTRLLGHHDDVTFAYDALGRITEADGSTSGQVQYAYTARGQRAQISYPSGTDVRYTYAADGQLAQVAVANATTPTATYQYDAAGRLRTTTLVNGAVTTLTYDGADRVRDRHTVVGGTQTSRFTYTLDRPGHRTASTETLGTTTRTITYTYDGLYRLTGAAESPGTTYAYSYDLVGNRTEVQVNGAVTHSHSYNAANQVVGWTYDDAGNLTNDGTRTYSYDDYDRLASVTQQGDSTNYLYNADGTLISELRASGTRTYTQDWTAGLSQVLEQHDGSTTTTYLYGHERLLAQTGTVQTWYGTDALGSMRQTLDDTGTPLASLSYDPWGTPQNSATPPTFGFTGELQDATSGLVYLRARWYQPGAASFLSRDPFAGFPEQPYSLHPYQYAYADPVLYTDPSGQCIGILGGLDTLLCAAAIGAAIGAGVSYGAQVYDNYQNRNLSGRDAWTTVDGWQIAGGAAGGAVAGAGGYILGPLLAGTFGGGLGGTIIGDALTGAASDTAAQIAQNVLQHGWCAWNENLGQAALIGALTGGIGGGLAWNAQKFATMYRFADRTNPVTIQSRLSQAPPAIQTWERRMLEDLDYYQRRADLHMKGRTAESPFVSLIQDPKKATTTEDPWLRTIATGEPGYPNTKRAPDIGKFRVPKSRLVYPKPDNLLSIEEGEAVFYGDDLGKFLKRWYRNPY